MTLRPPKLDSATFKGIVTALQTLCAFVVAAAADPSIMQLLTAWYPQLVPVVTASAGIVAFLLGYVRTDVRNY